MLQWLRRSFIAGFFVTVPLVVSVVALVWAFRFADGVTRALGERLFGTPWPGLGPRGRRPLASWRLARSTTNVFGRRVLQTERAAPAARAAVQDRLRAGQAADQRVFAGQRVRIQADGAGGGRAARRHARFFDQGIHGGPRPRPGTMLAVYVPTNHLYLGDIVICPPERAAYPDLTVEEGIRIFLTGGTGDAGENARDGRRQRRLGRLLGRGDPRTGARRSRDRR